MERREYEVSGLRECDGSLDGLEVAHFTDDDDIRILTEDRLDTIWETIELLPELALMHERTLVLVHEFYRIFEHDDMSLVVRIDIVEHGSHRR